MRKEGKVEEENHITELIVMSFIGCCKAADDKKPMYRPNYDYRVRKESDGMKKK